MVKTGFESGISPLYILKNKTLTTNWAGFFLISSCVYYVINPKSTGLKHINCLHVSAKDYTFSERDEGAQRLACFPTGRVVTWSNPHEDELFWFFFFFMISLDFWAIPV